MLTLYAFYNGGRLILSPAASLKRSRRGILGDPVFPSKPSCESRLERIVVPEGMAARKLKLIP
jgi:hypothetical protein